MKLEGKRMIKTLLGLILLFMPFLLIYKFEDKKVGFAYILSFLIAFHLAIAVLTQALGVFRYSFILGINIITDIIILTKIHFKGLKENFKKIKINKIDWLLIFIIIVLFIQLYSVHYNYTGKISTILGYKEVKNMKYPYPYFSDEWSSVSFIKYSLTSGKLPLVDPLWYDYSFPNLELPFHSFVSELILLLGLNPLTHYSILSLFSGILICILVYFILIANNINKYASTIASLSVPYIVNGANLPGIWTLIPLILGLISLLLGFLFMSLNKKKMVLFLAFLTLIFYPPLFVLYGISLISYFIFLKTDKKEKTKLIIYFLIICFIVVFLLSIFAFARKDFISYISKKIFYETFTPEAIPDFSIWKVIPIPILLLSIVGLKKIKNKSWLIAPIFVGLIYWFLYSQMLWRFITEYERVVVATSILIVILSGFGLHCLIEYLRKFEVLTKYKILIIIQISILIFFFIFSFSYTQRDNWQKLKLYSIKEDRVLNPASPSNNYLHPDDLKLFQNMKEKNFLSIPWKGTVIGTATNNYPLETKPATITNIVFRYNEFMKKDCKEKAKIAKEKEINYVYSTEFDCEGFELRGLSKEGLYLYEVVKS